MSQALYFQDDINTETVKPFIQELNNLSLDPEGNTEVFIYFSCPGGGEFGPARVMISELNRLASRSELTILYPFCMVSAGFDIFLYPEYCKKVIFRETFAMIHELSREVDIRDIRAKDPREIFLVENLERINKRELVRYRKYGVSGIDLAEFELAKDVWIGTNGLEEILKFQKDKGLIYDYALRG